ncbi:MAG: hypothetical protein ACRCZO_11780 [Cetobacterium sp.]
MLENKIKIMYSILEKENSQFHAGAKARKDTEEILKENNNLFLSEDYKFNNRYCNYFYNLIKFFLKIKNNFIFQFPNYEYYYYLIKFLKLKKVKSICLIHDLEGIRNKDEFQFEKDKKILKEVDYIISHNSKMTDELIKMGIEKEKIYNLEVFDYLLENKKLEKKEKTSDICFAGNLGKSPFIYKFDKKFKNIKIDIFGINYDEAKNKDSFNYKGAFPPDVIHEELTGKYGLIWDGDSLETCNGNMGEYMRYNNPHKLSLYIAAGIPVITWREAAIAEFVEKNNIGITVNSLYELEEYFNNLKDEDYDLQVENTLKIREKIINGEMFKKVFGEINEKLKK